MISSSEIGGMMAMMPAFATDAAADLAATDTVSVERLRAGLDRMVRDGADVIATTGSFGECHTLLPDEFETLARETAPKFWRMNWDAKRTLRPVISATGKLCRPSSPI